MEAKTSNSCVRVCVCVCVCDIFDIVDLWQSGDDITEEYYSAVKGTCKILSMNHRLFCKSIYNQPLYSLNASNDYIALLLSWRRIY
jgi:hypothetical protein